MSGCMRSCLHYLRRVECASAIMQSTNRDVQRTLGTEECACGILSFHDEFYAKDHKKARQLVDIFIDPPPVASLRAL